MNVLLREIRLMIHRLSASFWPVVWSQARSFTGHMGYFKKGAFQLADDLQLAVVPITIDGSFEILPRTGKWIHRHRMILTIHDPIPPKGKGPENIKETMTEAYAAVESALPERYKGMVKNEDQDR